MAHGTSEEQQESLIELIATIREEMRLAVEWNNTATAYTGLYPTDATILFFLYEHHAATANEVSKIANLTTGATTAALIRLEKGGFISRARDPNDKRRVIIRVKQLPRQFQVIRKISETELQNSLADTINTTIHDIITHRRLVNTMLGRIINELKIESNKGEIR